MSLLRNIIRRLADPKDRVLLDHSPMTVTRLRIIGRIGLKYWWAYLGLFFVLLLGTVSAGMDVYHRTEQPQFCGACHEMSHNFDTWEQSRHKSITCVDCHAQQGAVGWMKTKLAGLNQLRVHLLATSISGIKVQEDQRAIITDNCQRCHAGLARVGERLGLGVSHRQHLDKGMDCVTCHTGSFTHPGGSGGPATAAADHPTRALLESRFVDVQECYKCHDGKTTLKNKVAFSAREEENCLKCHPDSIQALAHGARHPSSAKRHPCLDCHEQQPEEPHFKMGDVGEICAKCHTQETYTSEHVPYSSSACDSCHRVMSPAYLFKKSARPTNAGCLTCHKKIARLLKEEQPAAVSAFADGQTDLHKRHASELDKDSNDWCLDCHAAHGSNASRGLAKIRPQGEGTTPEIVELNESVGGRCQGACHTAGVSYAGPTE